MRKVLLGSPGRCLVCIRVHGGAAAPRVHKGPGAVVALFGGSFVSTAFVLGVF